LDVIAALTPDHKYLSVAVVNATDQEQKFNLSVAGTRLSGPADVWCLTGSSLDASNHAGQPAQVEIKHTQSSDAAGAISAAPISITIYKFAVSQ
jgi:alpha-N-arabinofuranosidase